MPDELKPLTLRQAIRAAKDKCRDTTGKVDPESMADVCRAARRARLLAKTPPEVVELLMNRTRELLEARCSA